MEYKIRRQLSEVAPLLERLERGNQLSDEEQLELAAIQMLDSFGWVGTLPKSMGMMSALQKLDLTGANISDLHPLSELKNLQILNLPGTQVSDLSPLSKLSALQTLDLSGTQVSDLSPLSALPNLQVLTLWDSQVRDLGPLSELKGLRELDLSGTQVLDLNPLSGLSTLQVLDLSRSQINDLGPLSRMNSLQELYLHETQVSDLTPLSGLTNLQILYLTGTRISDLTPLVGLVNLIELDLKYVHIREIPQQLYEHFITVQFDQDFADVGCINLLGARISTQPISIFRERDAVIRAYYNAPKVSVRESKVIFLGDGGAGKTHTIKRILSNGKDENIDTRTTLGISINRFDAVGKNGSFNINFWDFGGQENMHTMHRCFLTERTLYVVVINNRWSLDQQARYWLNNIRSFAPDSPVILAVNLWEGIQKYGLDTNHLQRDYPNLKWIALYSAKGGEQADFDALIQHILTQAEELDSCAMKLPENWAAILNEMRKKATQIPSDRKKPKYCMSQDEYLALCNDHDLGGDGNKGIRYWLLEWFNDLGVCFSYHRDMLSKEELGTYKVLNPRWLTGAIYILLNAAKKYYKNGIMHLGSIEALLENPNPKKLERKDECDYILDGVSYDEEECQYILNVMRKVGLSYRIDENAEFIPALCDSEMPRDLYPSGYGTPVSYEFRYSFLPDSVVQRLMIRMCSTKSFSKLWRKGFRLDDPEHGLVTVVDAGGPNDTLRIEVYSSKEDKGRDIMMGLITTITAVNVELNLTPEQYIIVHGKRGEISVPADMILQAKEQRIANIHIYSKENGLVEKSVDEILGHTYGKEIIEAAKHIAEGEKRSLSETVPQIINNYNIYGNITMNDAPEYLISMLEWMVAQNIEVSSQFTSYLINELNDTGDDNAKNLADDVKQEKKGSILKTLTKGLKSLPKVATGAKTVLTDGKTAYDAAKPIVEAVRNALLLYGPQITEGLMEGLKLLPPV